MTEPTAGPRPILTVYSGEIIGAVVDALGLDHGLLKAKTARRFFSGKSVSDHSSSQIYGAIAQVLVEAGLVTIPPNFPEYGISMPDIVAAAIVRASYRWDKSVAKMQSESTTTADPGPAIHAFLRIVVVDLAVRVVALLRLIRSEPETPATPEWALENGGGRLLRRLLADAGLTRDQLSARVEVSSTSVDNWLDGVNRPTPIALLR